MQVVAAILQCRKNKNVLTESLQTSFFQKYFKSNKLQHNSGITAKFGNNPCKTLATAAKRQFEHQIFEGSGYIVTKTCYIKACSQKIKFRDILVSKTKIGSDIDTSTIYLSVYLSFWKFKLVLMVLPLQDSIICAIWHLV